MLFLLASAVAAPINGTPTGALVVGCEDPAALSALPFIDQVEPLSGMGDMFRVDLAPGINEAVAIDALLRVPPVQWAESDLRFQLVPHTSPDDPFFGEQWHLVNTGQEGRTPGIDIGADVAWSLATGEGALIAVLDSGVDTEHEDLVVIDGHDYISDDDSSFPDASESGGPHGTAAAGLAAATGNNGLGVSGVAWDAEVYGQRIIGGEGMSLSELYEAFVEAVDAGAWVLNNSWGFDNGCGDFPVYTTMSQMMEYAETEGRGGLGSVVVFSAGNGDCDNTGDGMLAIETVVSVAAIDDTDTRESYSSYGRVDIAAPSGGVITTDISGDDGYGSHNDDTAYYSYFTGTSASAPIVSGVFALMFDANPRLSAADAREVICQTGVRMDTAGGDYDEGGWSPYYGCGRIDAGAAVLAVANEAPLAPTPLEPGGPVYVDRVILEWLPASDADGDWLDYQIRWSVNGEEQIAETEGLRWDLGELEIGDQVRFAVTAIDLWGAGPESEPVEFEIIKKPTKPRPPASTCGTGAAGAWWLGLLVLGWRRRTT